MKKNQETTRTLLFVILAFVLFAVGFIGFELFQQNNLQDARNQPVPSLPAVK